MPDITMCEGKSCPFAYKCFRARAKPNKYDQCYFCDLPLKFKLGVVPSCEHIWEIGESLLHLLEKERS